MRTADLIEFPSVPPAAETIDSETIPAPLPVGPGVRAGVEPPAAPNALPTIQGAPQSVGGPLTLDEVLWSVETHYPLLQAAEQERLLAGGRLVSAMGAFDLNLTGGFDSAAPATYENWRSNFAISQGLPVAGLGVFAGYRNGYGEFPTYYLDRKTADGGEFRAGVTVPLLRDREIDRTRAAVRQGRLDRAIAEPSIERQRLDFQRAASRVFWNWVGAGQRLKVTQQLVDLAVERDRQLAARVEAGPVANIERIDNQQNIALRQGVLVQAGRAFQQATIDLSLFLRDGFGRPSIAGVERLPEFPELEPIDPGRFEEALGIAFNLRPEPRRIRWQREKAAIDFQLATNQRLPTLNATVAGYQDVGYGSSSLSGPEGLDRASLNAGVLFQMPLQQRDAKGRQMQAQAQLAQLTQQLRQAEDVVRAEVQDTHSALQAAYEYFLQARQRVELALTVAAAEREQLRLGRSDVLRVTLREQAAFDAAIVEITARQDYFRAVADFRAALGLGKQ